MNNLMERLSELAHDPKRYSDEGPGARDKWGKPLAYVLAPPASIRQVADAEKRLGFPLPPLLRQAYLEVANGGFGPGFGIYGLPVAGAGDAETAVGKYLALRERQTNPAWPKALVPICYWGSGIASYLDCSAPEAAVIRVDGNMPKANVAERIPASRRYKRDADLADACWIESPSLEPWLEAWANGKLVFYMAYGEPDDTEHDEDDEDSEDDETRD